VSFSGASLYQICPACSTMSRHDDVRMGEQRVLLHLPPELNLCYCCSLAESLAPTFTPSPL
jgi:hypothetical protein